MLDTNPLLPAWLVFPIALLTLLVLGGQFWVVSRSPMDPHRRRLRQAATFVMMVLTPLAAYGFGVAAPARGREYVIVWVLIASLLFIIIMLALLDLLHSTRLYRVQTAEVRKQLAQERARELAAALATARAAREEQQRNHTSKPVDHPDKGHHDR